MADTRPITHRRVLALSVPIVISNATVPLLGAVDTGVVGQLGAAEPIGAVAVGAMIITALFWLFGFLRMGTTGMVGQALGAGDIVEADALLSRAFLVAGMGGAALIVLQVPLMAAALALSQASSEVEAMAQSYVAIRIWSAPAVIAVYGITGWLVAREQTRAVLTLQITMNGVNILLDVWFVLGLNLGVPGVAWATLIAEWSGLALGLWFCRSVFMRSAWCNWARVADRARVLRMMTVGRDILLRSVMLTGGFLLFIMVFSARLGDVTLASNQVLMQFLAISAFALDGFAFAVESLVAQAMGAGQVGRLRRAAWLCTIWAFGSAVLMALAFALAGGWIIDTLTTAPEVREQARAFLPWVVIAPLAGVGAFILDGIFIGATRGGDMRNMMALSFVIYLGAIALLVPLFGNHGLWAAMVIFLSARGVTLLWKYPRVEADAFGGRGGSLKT